MNSSNQQNLHLLPSFAYRSINRCSLPAAILGSLEFQQHPTALFIDGVQEFYSELFNSLQPIDDPDDRVEHFKEYMRSCFLLDHLDEAGYAGDQKRYQRGKANYLRLLRGWMFNASGVEGAVMKSWVTSRFGLLPRNHLGPLHDYDSHNYQAYRAGYAQGLYNTNALEAQLDLLYSFCQYELQRRFPDTSHWHLYRGVNRLQDHDVLAQPGQREYVLLLNNLNSFSHSGEYAESFGDYVFRTEVPSAKILFFPELLPGILKGEREFLVIGGAYRVSLR
ncbi:NAD(+)--dinitrogen-reductase ADP-D-ribosyltransferase [Gynuella sp.]|uniref:NAD(+)--dinitrogen-reductase ADP-D-ribosyltransferase n=1 Tax=Gynuella sp. TaxID=2969146 RepID=UPI003D13594E